MKQQQKHRSAFGHSNSDVSPNTRHPLALAQQVLALNDIAPGRLRRQNLTLYFILYRETVKIGCTFLFFDVSQTEF